MSSSPKRIEDTSTTRRRRQHKHKVRERQPSMLADFAALIENSVKGPLSDGYTAPEVNE